MVKVIQHIDPEVSQAKFDEEVKVFMDAYEIQRRRGIMVLDCKFPDLHLAFAAPALIPAPIVFAVKINFTNYDLEPLSVVFVDPFTLQSLKANQVLVPFLRNIRQQGQVIPQALLQAEPVPDARPFLCIPGVREYHNHPAHTGDSWLLHRKVAGEGRLGFIVDKLYEYGISSLNGYNIQIQMTAPQVGLGIDSSKIPL
jgi:hypothetical protein